MPPLKDDKLTHIVNCVYICCAVPNQASQIREEEEMKKFFAAVGLLAIGLLVWRGTRGMGEAVSLHDES